jgi:hypothetical protein
MIPRLRAVVAAVILVVAAGTAVAHITPPVVLVSDRDAVVGLLAGARKFFVREVRLSPAERDAIQKEWGWRPDEEFYRFFLGRDGQGRLVAATVFVSEFTVHGPVRVAVALGPDGKVRGVTVVEVTEETYAWVKPLLDQDFAREYTGQDSHGRFGAADRLGRVRVDAMGQFYAQVIGSLVQRAAIVFDAGVLKRGDAA